MKKTWWQQHQKERSAEKVHHHPYAETAAAAAGTPKWLEELIAVIEAILGVIPVFEGHTTETTLRNELVVRLAKLKEGLPKE
jgi:hypothetical protein